MLHLHHVALRLALAVLAASCAIASDPDPIARATFDPPSGRGDDCASAFYWEQPDCPLPPLVALDDIEAVTGVDVIAPIDQPAFESVEEAAGWLADDSPVLLADHRGERKAYPLAILAFHEIVNDEVGGDPVVVTWCPLCNTGLAFRRTVEGEVLDFGTSGHLFRANLVMYDRQHENFWLQADGRAVVGEPWTGTTLERVATSLLGFATVAEQAPDARVLSRDTGHPDPGYGRNPYPAYDDGRGRPSFLGTAVDERLAPMARVVGVDGADPVAVRLAHLRTAGAIALEVDGTPVTVWWTDGQSSALDAPRVDDGRDVGQTGAFIPTLNGRTLVFASRAGTIVDEGTGSTWSMLGEAIHGPLDGASLERVPLHDTFWFAWSAFNPSTRLVGE